MAAFRRTSIVTLLLLFFTGLILLSGRPARAQDAGDAAAYFAADAQRTAPQALAALHPAHKLRRVPVQRRADMLPAASGSRMIAEASRYIGLRNPTGTRGPWCSDFVNMIARRAGLALADTSRMARNAVRLGHHVSDPRPGDLAVMRSHVTIVISRTGGVIAGLGGNQCGGRVCVSRYSAHRVLAYVRMGA